VFVDRPWNKISLIRLASGLLICFGVSSLLPLLLSSWIGSSWFSVSEIKDPNPIVEAILLRSNAPPALHRVLASLAEPDQISSLRKPSTSLGMTESNAVPSLLTNILSRALVDPRLRNAELLQEIAASDATRRSVQNATSELDQLRANRLVLQEGFPGALRSLTHRQELSYQSVRSYQFLTANLALQIGLLWVMTLFLRDEGLSWGQFLRGSADRPLASLPFAIGVGVGSTVLLLAVSAFSTWVWSLFDHAPQIQQPLLILQQSSGLVDKLFFTYLAIAGAPFFEELYFRGVLYPTLRQWGWKRGAWILSAALFGLIHFDREKFLPLTLFALILIAVYQHTRTLIAPIITHATFNLINFVLFVNQDAIRQAFKRSPVAP
jgi:membrane protease YdiL (CAAX protease family)